MDPSSGGVAVNIEQNQLDFLCLFLGRVGGDVGSAVLKTSLLIQQ
jgi:hypothetical protein